MFQAGPAGAQDRMDLLHLYALQKGRAFCFWPEDYPAIENVEEDLARNDLFVLRNQNGMIVAAVSVERDEKVDRLSFWNPKLAPAGEIARLAVHPDFQRQGLGRRMVAYAMQVLKKRGCKSLRLLVNSRRRYLVASRANTGVAAYCNLLLRHQLTDVIPTWESSVNVIDHMCDIGSEDCVVLFSFPRYSEMDRQAMQLAEDAGAKILVVTDRPSAPLARFATVLLTVDVDTNTFFNSYVGVQLVMEILCAGLSRRMGGANAEKLQLIDRYIGQLGVY